MKEWGGFNKIYSTYFDKNYLPAHAAFGANGLAFGARVEVDCISVERSSLECEALARPSIQPVSTNKNDI